MRRNAGLRKSRIQIVLRAGADGGRQSRGIADGLDPIGTLHPVDPDEDGLPGGAHRRLDSDPVSVDGYRLGSGLPQDGHEGLQIRVGDDSELRGSYSRGCAIIGRGKRIGYGQGDALPRDGNEPVDQLVLGQRLVLLVATQFLGLAVHA